MYSRRQFLRIGSLSAVGGFVLGGSVGVFGQAAEKGEFFPLPSPIFSSRINSFSRVTFDPLLNTNFSVVRKKLPPVSLRLVEIVGDEYKNSFLKKNHTDGFSLIFEIVGKDVLDDKIYKFSHPELGEFSVFISTVGRSGKRYQAVFSRVYL